MPEGGLLTGQEPHDGRKHCDDAVDDRHDDSSDRTDDCHDTVTDPLNTGHYCAHVDGVALRTCGKLMFVWMYDLVGRSIFDFFRSKDDLQEEGLLLTDEL